VPRFRRVSRGRYRVTLRWALRGRKADVARLAVQIDKRAPKLLGRKRRRLKVRVRRGTHNWAVVALDSNSVPLFVREGRFRIGR
jgi:hypothetical protein